MVVTSWPEAVQVIRDALDPFRPAVLVAAMDEMALSLQEGSGITQAFRALVQHVLQEIRFVSG